MYNFIPKISIWSLLGSVFEGKVVEELVFTHTRHDQLAEFHRHLGNCQNQFPPKALYHHRSHLSDHEWTLFIHQKENFAHEEVNLLLVRLKFDKEKEAYEHKLAAPQVACKSESDWVTHSFRKVIKLWSKLKAHNSENTHLFCYWRISHHMVVPSGVSMQGTESHLSFGNTWKNLLCHNEIPQKSKMMKRGWKYAVL